MKAAVLGKPIAHSLSPALHIAAYQALGLDDWTYQAIECDEAALAAFVTSRGPEWPGSRSPMRAAHPSRSPAVST